MLPLRNTIEYGLKKFWLSGKLLLRPKKNRKINYCESTSPDVKGKSFSSALIKKACEIIKFTSVFKGDGDLNIHEIIRASNVQFSSNLEV